MGVTSPSEARGAHVVHELNLIRRQSAAMIAIGLVAAALSWARAEIVMDELQKGMRSPLLAVKPDGDCFVPRVSKVVKLWTSQRSTPCLNVELRDRRCRRTHYSPSRSVLVSWKDM